ncbi:hypothetical protein ACQ4PT_013929 [Festuca glaucescens]
MESKFFRFLKLVGVGFKARTECQGRELFLKLGYSHEVQFTAPPAVRVFCFKPNIVCCTGLDKDRVHHFAGAVRSCKPPELYKGKGVLYIDEVVKLKQGKKQKNFCGGAELQVLLLFSCAKAIHSFLQHSTLECLFNRSTKRSTRFSSARL